MSFEWVDHTGDLAVRLRASDLAGLIESGVYALRALLFEGEPGPQGTTRCFELSVSGLDREDVLVQALSEALHVLQEQDVFPTSVQAEVPSDRAARLRLEGSQADGRTLRRIEEIKAVTYHAVEIRERDGALETSVVLDV
ncbi:MAG: archease [Myxococcota bacterium]